MKSLTKCQCSRYLSQATPWSALILKSHSERKYKLQPVGYVCACGKKYDLLEWLGLTKI